MLTRATPNRVGRVPGPEAARITTLHHLPGFWARLVSREAQGEEPDSGEGRAWVGKYRWVWATGWET